MFGSGRTSSDRTSEYRNASSSPKYTDSGNFAAYSHPLIVYAPVRGCDRPASGWFHGLTAVPAVYIFGFATPASGHCSIFAKSLPPPYVASGRVQKLSRNEGEASP